jgi:hypothetical protein
VCVVCASCVRRVAVRTRPDAMGTRQGSVLDDPQGLLLGCFGRVGRRLFIVVVRIISGRGCRCSSRRLTRPELV